MFNGEETNPGTKWLLNGQIITSQSVNAQVNDNGTLVFLRQSGQPVYMLTCQNESTFEFSLTLKGKLAAIRKRDYQGLIIGAKAEKTLEQHHQCYKHAMGDLSL